MEIISFRFGIDQLLRVELFFAFANFLAQDHERNVKVEHFLIVTSLVVELFIATL